MERAYELGRKAVSDGLGALDMARAILQGADLVVLDESFAELDPGNLRHCLTEVAELSGTLVVVAHA